MNPAAMTAETSARFVLCVCVCDVRQQQAADEWRRNLPQRLSLRLLNMFCPIDQRCKSISPTAT